MIEVTTELPRFMIRCSYEAKDLIKALPGARWHAQSKRWHIPATAISAQNLASVFPDVAGDEEFNQKLNGAAAQASFEHMKNDPWDHHVPMVNWALSRDGAMYAVAMGGGKTYAGIATACNCASSVLILCPLAVVGVWPREFKQHSSLDWDVISLQKGACKKKTEDAQQHVDLAKLRGSKPVVVINYDSAWREPFKSWALSQKWDLVIFDESHRIKAPGGKASKFCAQLGDRARKRLALTGTPMPHSPLDLYAQFRAVDKGAFGTSFTMFRAKYAVMGGYGGYQVTGYQNQDDLVEKFRSVAIEFDDSVLDLPEATDIPRPFDLSPSARRTYDRLENNFYAEVESGEVTAANALVKLLRLQQITSGYLKLDGGGLDQIDSGKSDLLADIVEDINQDEPIAVICKFRKDIDQVHELAEKTGRRFGAVYGDRKDLVDGKMPENVDLMAVQIQSGGAGIDLTRARYGIFFSLGFSRGDYDQVRKRIHRPGQTRPVTYYHLICQNTVDEGVYAALKKRADVIQSLLERGR